LLDAEQVLNAIGFGTIQNFFGIINKISMCRVKWMQFIQALPEFDKFFGMSDRF